MTGGDRFGHAGLTRRGMIAGGAAGMLAACGRRDPDALTFWATGYEGDYSPHLLAAFTRATGMATDAQSLPGSAAHEKYLTAFAGASLPDVMMLPSGWVSEFAMIGAIEPLADPALAGDGFPDVMRPLTYGGVAYAVPWSVGSQVQFYRRDILGEIGFDTAPSTWDGWRTVGARLKRRYPDRYAMLMFLNWWDTLVTFASAAGAYPLRAGDTRGNFRTPAYREALSFYVSLFADGYAPGVSSNEIQDPMAAFARGYFTLYPSGPTLLTDLRRRVDEIAPDRWGTARMPGPDGPGRVSAINNSLAVSTRSRRKADAWALVRHLTSVESELTFQRMIGVLPARRSAWRDPQLADPVLRPFAEQMELPARLPTIVEWERIRLDVQIVAERVVRGGLTIDEGLAAMDTRVDAILAKRRALVAAGRIA
ncbi:extracellular solute-binding protein [Sphingomonas sp. Leaf412]|uniref:extracellular solute-binding protein n=1 Tax=Sphingomonas sp. Leaf412 TaxID=1736370 RepID=UPI000B223E6F|nr:extracellular solute-binding protein [Sphingomonas sp. Leaf412]